MIERENCVIKVSKGRAWNKFLYRFSKKKK